MQPSFKEFFIKGLNEKRKKTVFWLNHGFFYVAVLFVLAAGLVSISEEMDWVTFIVVAVVYPFGALAFEAYLSYQKYQETMKDKNTDKP